MEITKQDFERFFVAKPDPSFNPEKCKRVIEDSIKKYEANRAKKLKEYDDLLGERIDAASSYLHHLHTKGTQLEKYFGRKELARLQGKQILETIQGKVIELSSL